jgi:signal transduction histidine kinase/CheY-like chemotaxis protein
MEHLQGSARYIKDSAMSGLPMVAFSYANVSELHEALTKLQQKDLTSSSQSLAKTRILAHASHELRNPLNGIIGLSRALLDSDTSKFTAEQLENVRVIESCGEELLRHVENLLVMSKLESNVLPVASLPVDIRRAVDGVVQMIEGRQCVTERARAESNVQIHSEIDENVPQRVLGDEGHIKSVLANLVSNAIKATAQGSVTIKVRKSRAMQASNPAREQSNFDWQNASALANPVGVGPMLLPSQASDLADTTSFLEFRVVDTGFGIPNDEISNLFHPYSQIASTYARTYQGTGLGLSISKNLVTAMGGRIGVKSKVGQGSEFWFVIPAPVAREFPIFSEPTKVKEKLAITCPIESILCVEDNNVNLRVLTSFLRQFGYTDIDTAEDGDVAWDMIEKAEKPYKLVLSDVVMPRMCGTELVRLIRQVRKEVQPFVVLLSASALESTILLDERKAPDLFLMKPTRKETLANALQQASTYWQSKS